MSSCYLYVQVVILVVSPFIGIFHKDNQHALLCKTISHQICPSGTSIPQRPWQVFERVRNFELLHVTRNRITFLPWVS